MTDEHDRRSRGETERYPERIEEIKKTEPNSTLNAIRYPHAFDRGDPDRRWSRFGLFRPVTRSLDGVVPMSESTSDSPAIGPFEGGFGIGAAVVGVVSILFGAFAGYQGYMGGGMVVRGVEPLSEPLLQGIVLLAFASAFGIVALFAGAYMEPGVRGDQGH
ncbi:hypothetical protein SAMN04488556_2983 [Halostagnicola kamekurae]|uniref:Uncharacterized protein n=2 Tax=Halostagnicola kamekurae TaxID=619731 RepID=A0A1I6SXR0_9EURY|nr:hypothetical protein SAMN04488556_2983 [Halostagnicola kamekurae]